MGIIGNDIRMKSEKWVKFWEKLQRINLEHIRCSLNTHHQTKTILATTQYIH